MSPVTCERGLAQLPTPRGKTLLICFETSEGEKCGACCIAV